MSEHIRGCREPRCSAWRPGRRQHRSGATVRVDDARRAFDRPVTQAPGCTAKVQPMKKVLLLIVVAALATVAAKKVRSV
jgi:hypothetical protein